MTYCIKCGTKNEDDAEFCKKCGTSLSGKVREYKKDDDCVCSGSKQNPFVQVFWGLVVILFGIWVIFSFIIPSSIMPMGMHDFSFGGLIILIIALAILLTGFRILTK